MWPLWPPYNPLWLTQPEKTLQKSRSDSLALLLRIFQSSRLKARAKVFPEASKALHGPAPAACCPHLSPLFPRSFKLCHTGLSLSPPANCHSSPAPGPWDWLFSQPEHSSRSLHGWLPLLFWVFAQMSPPPWSSNHDHLRGFRLSPPTVFYLIFFYSPHHPLI